MIKRAILFGGKAIVSVMDTTKTVDKAMKIHSLSQSAGAAMGKALTVAAFMSAGFKGVGNKLTIIVDGDGEGGRMVLCGDYGAKVRGYMEHPRACEGEDAPVPKVVGKNGSLTVIKDFGLKEPYNGLSQIVNGNIDEDFAYYFTVSEQLPSAVALGVKTKKGGCVKAGGIVVQPMPNCSDEEIFILQDIVGNFTDVATLLCEKSAEEILSFYFGHFEISHLPDVNEEYKCSCSRKRIQDMLLTLGKSQAMEIIESEGKIQVGCEFCNSKYEFDIQDVERMFS